MTPRRPATKRDITKLDGLRVGLYCRVSVDPDGTEKSVDDQEAEGRRWIERRGARLADVYRDSDRSASRFAKKEREDFGRLLADIDAGKLDLVWFWELSRSQRRLDVFAKLRDRCRACGVLWVVRDRVYDPDDYKDMVTPAVLSVMAEMESEQTSERVRRGLASNATAGKVHGMAPYGYKRIYDPISRDLISQDPDVFDGDGGAVEDSPAWVVREIFRSFAGGVGVGRIAASLNARGIAVARKPGHSKASAAPRWWPTSVRQILKNPVYIARRVHQGQVLEGVTGQWPALIDEETFWTCQRILADPARRTTRPARATHLLSYVARCCECGEWMWHVSYRGGPGQPTRHNYTCSSPSVVGRGCSTSIKKAVLDEYVEEIVMRWLSHPAVFAALTAVDNSPAAAAARADATQLRLQLEDWRQQAEQGDVSPTSFGRVEKGLLARIAEAERIAEEATLPPVLVGNIGPEAAARWERLDVAVKRQIIATVADIRVRRIGKGRAAAVPLDHRISWRWLLVPGAVEQVAAPDLDETYFAERSAVLRAARRERQRRAYHAKKG